MAARLDITGQRFGRLLAIRPAGFRLLCSHAWICKCDCGNEVVVPVGTLRAAVKKRGDKVGCGCIRREMMVKHGATGTPEYRAYKAAQSRCRNPKNRAYKYYGGQGIEFRFKSFQEFIAHIGPRPGPRFSLDRKRTHGHYEIGNVRWATQATQVKNQRSVGRAKALDNRDAFLLAASILSFGH